MLDFGFSEILLTSAIALVVLGPERLPKVARQFGHWMGRARSMARQLSEQLEREIDAEELLKTQDKAKSAQNRIGPVQSVPPAARAAAAVDPLYPAPLAPDGHASAAEGHAPLTADGHVPATPIGPTATAPSVDASKPPNE